MTEVQVGTLNAGGRLMGLLLGVQSPPPQHDWCFLSFRVQVQRLLTRPPVTVQSLHPQAQRGECHLCPLRPQPSQWLLPLPGSAPALPRGHRCEGTGLGVLWVGGGQSWWGAAGPPGPGRLRHLPSPHPQVTSSALAKALRLLAVSGPTWDQLPPFQWSTSPFSGMLHMGQPDLWKFSPIEVSWD